MARLRLLCLLLSFFFLFVDETFSKLESSFSIPTKILARPNKPGQLFASLGVGTPPQEFWLIADTGSHITWINCDYRCKGVRHTAQLCSQKDILKLKKLYHPKLSASFKSVPSLSDFCYDVYPFAGRIEQERTQAPCKYQISYDEGGSDCKGIFGNETVMLQSGNGGHAVELHDVLIGCTTFTSSIAASDLGGADGLLGLGNYQYSFAKKLFDSFGKFFSYCWVDIMYPNNNTNTYLVFGNNTYALPLLPKMQHTQLFLINEPHYGLKFGGISINGAILKIPSEVWMYMDSGMGLTYLVKEVYESVITALKAPLVNKFKKAETKFSWGEGKPKLEFCFNATIGFVESMVPNLAFHFSDGAQFVPPVRNYVLDVEPGIRCIGFYPSKKDINVIGSIMQQGHHWEYNLATKKLGFAPSTCA